MQEGQADQRHRNRINLGITYIRFMHAVSAIKQINKNQYCNTKALEKEALEDIRQRKQGHSHIDTN